MPHCAGHSGRLQRDCPGGHLAYNATINETNTQQMLVVVVHNRYAETSHLLNVANVTANVCFY